MSASRVRTRGVRLSQCVVTVCLVCLVCVCVCVCVVCSQVCVCVCLVCELTGSVCASLSLIDVLRDFLRQTNLCVASFTDDTPCELADGTPLIEK